jgi:hypothetical protein
MTRLLLILSLACVAASMPPIPRKSAAPVESPKGKEARVALAKVSAPRIVIPPAYRTNTLVWGGDYKDRTVGFSIQWKQEMTSPWKTIALVTNQFSYVHPHTNDHGFYRVGAFWP